MKTPAQALSALLAAAEDYAEDEDCYDEDGYDPSTPALEALANAALEYAQARKRTPPLEAAHA